MTVKRRKSKIEIIVNKLKKYDWSSRKIAAEGLLKSRDWRRRGASVRALGDSGKREAVPILMDSLKDEDRGVSKEAAKALVKLKDFLNERDFFSLIGGLSSENPHKRDSAVYVLRELMGTISGFRHFALATMLSESLKHSDRRVRIGAVRCLGKFAASQESEDDLIVMLGDGPEARTNIVPILDRCNTEKSRLFLMAFYYNVDVPVEKFRGHIGLVEKLSESEYPLILTKAMDILFELDKTKWMNAVRMASLHRNLEIRIFAVESLMKSNSREAGRTLKKMAERDTSTAGKMAGNYLIHRKTMYMIGKFLENPLQAERLKAVDLLMEMENHPEARRIIYDLAENDSTIVGDVAREMLDFDSEIELI